MNFEDLKKVREEKGVTQEEVAAIAGVSVRQYQKYEDGSVNPKIKTWNKIDAFLDGNANKSSQPKGESYRDNLRNLKNNRNNKRPMISTHTQAGPTSGETPPIIQTEEMIDVGDMLRDSQMAMQVQGNSMTPNYPSGCVVGLVKCESTSMIEPGEVYVIETVNGPVLKRLYYPDISQPQDHFILYSDSTLKHETGPRKGTYHYPPFEVFKTDIKGLWRVAGVIKRNMHTKVGTA